MLNDVDPFPGERPGRKDVFDLSLYAPLVEALPGQTLIDFGCGSPALIRYLVQKGKRIWGYVSYDREAEVRKALDKLPVRIIPTNLFAVEPLPSKVATYSVGVLHHYYWDEVRLLARKQMEMGTPAFIGVPAVYDTEEQAGGLWRREQWEDLVRGMDAQVQYLGDRKAVMATIKGEGRSVTTAAFGMVVDGIWRPRDTTVKAEQRV
jgi:hypothetical protein